MDPLTHVATGVICSQLVPAPSRWWAAVAGILFALLPDVDYFIIFWNRLDFIRFHRGFTHSLVALVLFALAGALVGRFLGGPRWFKPLLILGLVVLSSHLLLDLITSYGTQLYSPFSGRRLSLDWVFIIDPYLTFLLVLGAVASLLLPRWGPRLGGAFLALAIAYVMVGAAYHHQALKLARRIFSDSSPRATTVAALPQPFSCRRWHLIASSPEEIRQAFVQLPWEAALGWGVQGRVAANVAGSPSNNSPSLSQAYQAPHRLTVQTWITSPPAAAYSPTARRVLDSYLDFARFPCLCRSQSQGQDQLLEWLDLRFTVPGRAYPFVLQLRLDAAGNLKDWLIGHRGWDRKQ